MASKFTRFNKTRIFDVNLEEFREGTFKCEEIFQEVGDAKLEVLGIWRHEYTKEVLDANPGLPDHNYTVGLRMGEGDAAFMFVPATMTNDFDEIMADPSLVKEIKAGRCLIQLYAFKSRRGEGYSFTFC